MKAAGWLLVCACALIACGKSDTKHEGKSAAGDKAESKDKDTSDNAVTPPG